MSTPQQPPAAAVAAAASPAGKGSDVGDDTVEGRDQVGITDVAAGGDMEANEPNAGRDTDGVPVGRADAEEDAARSGADRDEVSGA